MSLELLAFSLIGFAVSFTYYFVVREKKLKRERFFNSYAFR